MQITHLFKTGTLCVTALALGLLPTQAQITATWVGPATGGLWNTDANWDTAAVPGVATNAIIAGGAVVNYSAPMLAPSIANLYLSGAAVLNLNAAGFNVDSGLSSKSMTIGATGSSGTLNLNAGGALTVSNAGSLYLSTNGTLVVNTGGTLLITNALATDGLLVGDNKRLGSSAFRGWLKIEGGTATINNRVTIAGSTSGTSGGSEIVVNSGLLNLLTGCQINNTTDDGGCRFLVNGGSAAIGNFSVGKSSPNPGAGLVISNGVVNATGIQIGTANSRAYGAIYGGVLTNSGPFTVSDTTTAATSGNRQSRFVVLGGTVVATTPDGIIVGNQANASAATSSVIGGFLDVIAGTVYANGITLVRDNTIANAYGTLNLTNTGLVYLGSIGLVGNVGAGGSGYFINFGGGTLGATADFPISGNVRLVSGTTTIQAADASGNPFKITASGVWSSAGSLNKTGTGVLELDGVNTYSGNTLVNGGTLALGAAGTLASPLIVVGPTAKLDVSALGTAYTFNAGQTIAGSGVVTGAVTMASATTVNPGSNVLTGTLTFANDLVEAGGVLNHFDLPAAPTGPGNDSVVVSNLTVSGLNTIEINGASPAGAYKLYQYESFNGNLSNFSLTGVTGSLSNSVANKALYLVITASVRGPTNVVWVGNAAGNIWDMVTTTNWLNNGALDFFVSGDNAWFNDAGAANPLVSIAGSVTPTSVTVDATASFTFTGNGLISGFGGLTKTNSGTLTVLTTNTYTGITAINGGVLEVSQLANGGQPSSIGASGNEPGSLVISNGTFRYFGSDVTIDRGATLASSASALDVSLNGALTLGGTLVGSGSLTKTGNGTLVLNAGNSFGGGTFVNAGTLTVNNATALGAGLVTLNGGNLALGAVKPANVINVAAPGVIIGGNSGGATGIKSVTGSANLTIAVTGGTTFDLTGDMTTYSGTLTLSNVSGGFVRFNGSTGSQLATWDLGQQTMEINMRTSAASNNFGGLKGGVNTSLVGRSTTDNNGPTTHYIGWNGLNTTFDGVMKSGGSSQQFLHIVKVGTGTLTLRGANTYTGTTSVSNGVLALANNPDTGGDGSIDGTSLINLQAGTAVDVSARSDGTLQLGGGQTLRGRGTILGSLNVSGTVAPGDGITGATGILTVTNGVTLNGTAWMKLNRDASPNSDRLVSTLATITYGGNLIVTNTGAKLKVGDTFTLFSGPGLSTVTFNNLSLPGYYTWDTSNLGVNGTVSVTAVTPPPAITNVDFASLASGTITLNATGGLPNTPVTILTTTNLALPLGSWTTTATTQFDADGNILAFPVTVDPALPQNYLLIKAE